jgi:hypothetical protein
MSCHGLSNVQVVILPKCGGGQAGGRAAIAQQGKTLRRIKPTRLIRVRLLQRIDGWTVDAVIPTNEDAPPSHACTGFSSLTPRCN